MSLRDHIGVTSTLAKALHRDEFDKMFKIFVSVASRVDELKFNRV
jgi:hypothetical protein